MSLPSWERGLKLSCVLGRSALLLVAPLVGAWIEMPTSPAREKAPPVSLPSWERGLKYLLKAKLNDGSGRSPRGSVD